MVDLSEYEALRLEPREPHVMYQRWRSLTFLHFACDPDEIQKTLPTGLTVDTFPDQHGREQAWVGLVPFRMEGVRPRFLPPVPGLSAFPETNLRTYVHRDGREPGVWFYSLDAGNAIACSLARRAIGLPYHHARMSVTEQNQEVRYASDRVEGGALCRVDTNIGLALGAATPGTLDFFLIERYQLYSILGGRIVSGRVHHAPYLLRAAQANAVADDLVMAAGITPRPYSHRVYSPGVDVRIYAPKLVEGRDAIC